MATCIFTVLGCIASSFKIVISSAVHLLSYKNFHLLTCPMISHARAFPLLLSHITIKYAQILIFSTKQRAQNHFFKYNIFRENIISDLYSYNKTSHRTFSSPFSYSMKKKSHHHRVSSPQSFPVNDHTPSESTEIPSNGNATQFNRKGKAMCWVSGF